jgi:hypothetical protein
MIGKPPGSIPIRARVGPWFARLQAVATRKTPPSPQHVRPLPTAHGQPYSRGHIVIGTRTPARPAKPERLRSAQAQAARLRLPRDPRLIRPELHRDHDHAGEAEELEAVALYALGEGPALTLPPLPSWTRWRIAGQLDQLDAATASHRWGQLWRIDDVRVFLQLDRPDRNY